MEDYEILRKFFIDKEKENIKLKEELDLLKSKMDLSSDIKINNKSQVVESRNLTEIPPRIQSDTNFNSSAIMENPDNKNEEFLMDKSNYAYISKSLSFNKAKEKNGQVQLNNGTLKDEFNHNFQIKLKNELRETIAGIPNIKSSEFLKFPDSNQSMNENIPTPILKSLNSSKDHKTGFFPSEYDKSEDENKGRNFIIKSNKNVIRNIESNITELKKHLNSYESAYNNINLNLDSNETEKSLDKKLDYINNELFIKLKLQEQELRKVKELYENELIIKNEIYDKNIFHLNQTHQEEVRKLRISYENKIDELIKKSEEEKVQHNKKFSLLESELKKIELMNKNEINEKNELIEFKKKYVDEMKELQKSFENFKTKTFTEFKAMKKLKEDSQEKVKYFQDLYEKQKLKNETLEKNYMESSKESKILIKTNEQLMSQLDNSKSEFNLLKAKLENIEKMFMNTNTNINNNIITASSYKSIKYIQSEMNTLTKEENSENNINQKDISELKDKQNMKHIRQLSRCSDLVNYQNMPNNHILQAGNVNKTIDNYKNSNKMSSNVYDMASASNYNSDLDDDNELHASKLKDRLAANTLDQNLYKAINLKKAHEKIKEMEENLKYMNEENENLKGKLGYVINNISNMNNLSNNPSTQTLRKSSNNQNTNVNNYNQDKNFVAVNGNANNQYIDDGVDKNKSQFSSVSNLHKYSTKTNTNYANVSKIRRWKNYSTQIHEDWQFQLNGENDKKTRDISPNVNFGMKHYSAKEKIGELGNNGSLTNKLVNSVQVSPFVYDEKKKIINFRNMSPGEKRGDSGKKNNLTASKNESYKGIEEYDSMDEKVIEFPLQIKIKGKIRKIPTGERSPKKAQL